MQQMDPASFPAGTTATTASLPFVAPYVSTTTTSTTPTTSTSTTPAIPVPIRIAGSIATIIPAGSPSGRVVSNDWVLVLAALTGSPFSAVLVSISTNYTSQSNTSSYIVSSYTVDTTTAVQSTVVAILTNMYANGALLAALQVRLSLTRTTFL
jgi:hypothetical protein